MRDISLSLVRHTGGNSLGAVTPGETFGTLYTFGVGTNKIKQTTEAHLRSNQVDGAVLQR